MKSPVRLRIPLRHPASARRTQWGVPWALLGLALASPAEAQWAADPAVNLPVCTAPGAQYFQNAVTDGSGGMIVAWSDERSDTADVYVQRVTAAGAAVWAPQGVRICGAAWEQGDVTLIADGLGGAFVAWRDDRSRWESDVYAQRVDAAGQPLWAEGGVPVCRVAGDQLAPRLVGDGWGVIVVWEDRRVTSGTYAQRLGADGTRLWDTSGVALSTAPPPRFEPVAAGDGLGGAIVAWTQQGANGYDVVAQRVDANGQRRWGDTGRLIAGGPGEQVAPAIVAAGLYRVFIAWEDGAGGSTVIRAQSLDITGASPFPGGAPVTLSAAPRAARRPALVWDGIAAAIVTWHETLAGAEDVRAQHVSSSGTQRWSQGGALLCTAPGIQQFPAIVADGRGGALIAWEDQRSGAWDIHAQRIDSLGGLRWGSAGVVVSNARGGQYGPAIVAHADTVALVVWTDQRAGGTDIHAQRLPFAVTLGVPSHAAGPLTLTAGPNPSSGVTWIACSLTSASEARVWIHDAAGRRVRELFRGAAAAGAHRLLWDGRDDHGRLMPPGIYRARLRAGGREGGLTLVRIR